MPALARYLSRLGVDSDTPVFALNIRT